MQCFVGALILSMGYPLVLGHEMPPGGLVWQNCTNPHEYYDCGSFCQTECKTLGDPCPVQTFRCVDACYCIARYARDENGVCIPQEMCPPKPPKKKKCEEEPEFWPQD